jgi:hypothetical protein
MKPEDETDQRVVIAADATEISEENLAKATGGTARKVEIERAPESNVKDDIAERQDIGR